MIVVLDYGMGNLGSVARAVRHLGYDCSVKPNLEGATKLIVPGVGAFGAAMEQIGPLATSIRRFAQDGHPLLGICLGQQLLFEASDELGSHQGLGLLRGEVKYFPPNMNLKVPHIGWNELAWTSSKGLARESVKGDQVYFVHSLYTDCANSEDVAAWTEYGIGFASAVMRDNVWGTQFHPEKSGEVGLRILRSFLES